MAKPMEINLPDCDPIAIIYEDRSVLAIDKPAGWMLVPLSWQKTQRNLLAALSSSVIGGDYWARSRNLKFLRFIHRLDGDTSGVMLFAKSMGALETFSELFEMRRIEKVYLAVTDRAPKEREWICTQKLEKDPTQFGRVRVGPEGKASETAFRVVATAGNLHLLECRPRTGRQHQIRVHLLASGCPIIGDRLYGPQDKRGLALRSVGLAYWNPFTRQPVGIRATVEPFLKTYGFSRDAFRVEFRSLDQPPDWRIRRDDMPDLDDADDESGEEQPNVPSPAPRGEFRGRPRTGAPGERRESRSDARPPLRDFRGAPARPEGPEGRGGGLKRPDQEYQSRPPQGRGPDRSAPSSNARPTGPRRFDGPARGPQRPPGKFRPPAR